MRPILQTEATECGLASIAMLSEFHGHKVGLNGLRQRFGLSLKGARLRDLMNMATELGFSVRALRLEPEALKNIALPAILHWDLNHFVVLKKCARRKFVVFDPARGRVQHSSAEFSKHFSGVALELLPAASFQPIEARNKPKLTSLWSRLSGWRRSFVQVLILSIVLQLVVLASPFYLQLVVDEAVTRFDKDFLLFLALGFGALHIVNAFTKALRSWVTLLLGQSMTFQMAGNVLRHLLRLPANYFEKRHVGDIISRMSSIQPIQTALTQSAVTAIIDGVMACATVVLMLIYSWKLAMIAVAFAVTYLIISCILFPLMRAKQQGLIARSAKEQSYIIESIRASRAVKLFSQEVERESTWRNLYADVISSGISYSKLAIGRQFAAMLLFGLQVVLIVYFGAQFILQGKLTVGMLFAFMAYRQQFTATAEGLVEKGIEFRMLGLHLERLADIVHANKEEGLATPRSNGRKVSGKIELASISFHYSQNDPFVFEKLSLSISPGEFIAISGPSGGGKSTLFNVMLGLQSPTSGCIRVDGLPLLSFGLRNWRAATGVVMQDDHLLSGTIADNVSFFDPQIDMRRVIESARFAQIHADVCQMPMQYLSMVGDMGSALSGGQRQRILLARALYRKPSVLFLDEGTANLDLHAEKQIADLIAQMNITRVVIAHRPELLSRADRVFHMINGELVQVEATQAARNRHADRR